MNREPDKVKVGLLGLMIELYDRLGPALVVTHQGPGACYTTVGQFRAAGVANYFCWRSASYDYTVTGLNEYYTSILEMADRGWPGGLRWLHGEEE